MTPRYKVFNATTGEPLAHVGYVAQAVGLVSDYAWKHNIVAAILDTYTDTILT